MWNFNFFNKQLTFFTMAEKQQIMETAIFGGYSGLTAPIIIFFCILSQQKTSFKKMGWSKAILKYGTWQLTNSKITGRKLKNDQEVVK